MKKEESTKTPEECKACKRSQCPLECIYLDARTQVTQGDAAAETSAANDDEIKMSGTY